MIAYLRGVVQAQTERGCVLLTAGGVGYDVRLTSPTISTLPEDDSEIAFHIHTIVREDAIELYGFTGRDECVVFALLLSISKLGAKKSAAILSHFSPDDLRRLVIGDDYAPLAKVPGIGKKSAQSIFVELKYKLDVDEVKPSPSLMDTQQAGGRFRDALTGLTNLGYDEGTARAVLEKLFADEPDLDTATALRKALQAIGKAKA